MLHLITMFLCKTRLRWNMSCLYQQLMEDARLRLRFYTMSCQRKSPNLLFFRMWGLCISPLSLVESERASLLQNWRERRVELQSYAILFRSRTLKLIRWPARQKKRKRCRVGCLQSLESCSRPLKKSNSSLRLSNLDYIVNRWDVRRLNCYFDVVFVHGGLM